MSVGEPANGTNGWKNPNERESLTVVKINDLKFLVKSALIGRPHLLLPFFCNLTASMHTYVQSGRINHCSSLSFYGRTQVCVSVCACARECGHNCRESRTVSMHARICQTSFCLRMNVYRVTVKKRNFSQILGIFSQAEDVTSGAFPSPLETHILYGRSLGR